MRKKIVIFGHYGVPNWGDEAILSGIISQINIARFSVTVISHAPQQTETLHNVKALSPPPFGIRSFFSFQWIQTIKEIKNADYIIIGGGGLWQPKPLKAMALWNFYLDICLFFEKKVLSLGTSFSILSNPSSHTKKYKKIIQKTTKLFKKVKFFTVRDTQSEEILKNTYHVHSAKINTTADAAFFLEPPTHTSKKKCILLAMREGDISIEQEKIILSALQQQFPLKTYTFECIVMQSHQSHDEKFAERHKNISVFYPENIEQLLSKISSAHFVCSSRLHANILASVCSTNFLAISCRDKVKNLLSESLPQNIIDAHQIKKTKKSIQNFQTRLKILQSHNAYNFTEQNNKFLTVQKKKLQNFFPDILQ